MQRISVYSNDYPPLLKEISIPPSSLYLKGGKLSKDGAYIAVVGTRVPSAYGLKMAYETAAAITVNGGTVVSGLAFGVDAACHRAAVDLNKPTVAVLASGVNNITPFSNGPLAAAILKTGGTLVSEYPDARPPLKYSFLQRNRIISGMCGVTVVIEAGEKSGALITARHAFDQNRDVYALAGDIDRPQGAGCRRLIESDMARPFFSIKKLLAELGIGADAEIGADAGIGAVSGKNIATALDMDSIRLLKILAKGPLAADDIPQAAGLSCAAASSALSILEITGLAFKDRFGLWRADKSRGKSG